MAEPDILLGERPVVTYADEVHLLQGAPGSGDDPLPTLAAQVLAAQLKLAVGAECCLAVDEAVGRARLLRLATSYSGVGSTLGAEAPPEVREQARLLVKDLVAYNAGTLCR